MPISPDFYAKYKDVLAKIFVAYSRSPRLYHTLHHINKMLEQYSVLVNDKMLDYNELDVLIILMHDYIYEPAQEDNERQSALAATEMLDNMLNRDELRYISNGIIATEKHEKTGVVAYDYICDMDCSYLGASKDVYNLCVAGIRYEYLRYIDEKYWTSGRKNFLRNMLSRDRIFVTDYYSQKLEDAARENVKREIEFLVEIERKQHRINVD